MTYRLEWNELAIGRSERDTLHEALITAVREAHRIRGTVTVTTPTGETFTVSVSGSRVHAR